jgi:hypothetical protein
MNTPIDTQTEILAELWMDYRDELYFREFFEYADLGLPLAYLITNNIVTRNSETDRFIGDTWELLMGVCGHPQDTGFEDLSEVLSGIDLEEE